MADHGETGTLNSAGRTPEHERMVRFGYYAGLVAAQWDRHPAAQTLIDSGFDVKAVMAEVSSWAYEQAAQHEQTRRPSRPTCSTWLSRTAPSRRPPMSEQSENRLRYRVYATAPDQPEDMPSMGERREAEQVTDGVCGYCCAADGERCDEHCPVVADQEHLRCPVHGFMGTGHPPHIVTCPLSHHTNGQMSRCGQPLSFPDPSDRGSES